MTTVPLGLRVSDAASVASRVNPQETGLGEYTFLPYHRTGAAGGCTRPFSTGLPSRAGVTITVTLTDGVGTAPATTPVTLRGPGDVLGIDVRQVVRRYPEPGSADAEPSDLAHCELDLPDLPWMFTPAAPDAQGRLPPWLRLVVVPTDADPFQLRPPARPGLPPSVVVPVAELPPAADAWAWAHVQVIGPPEAAGTASLSDRLGPASPQLNVARLLCPRRLEQNRHWAAFLVPTFAAGRQAGLGGAPVADLSWSWPQGDGDDVRLPYYDRWEFSTGADGDFETLAERLTPVAPSLGVGRRLVDTHHPGAGLRPTGVAGAREVRGALVVPDTPPPSGPVPGQWDDDTTQRLRARVELPDRTAADPSTTDVPLVAPPLYGGAHLATGVLPDAGGQPRWLAELNLDPEHRIAAALGAATARMDQEELMTSAWAQLPAVRDANAALRAGQLARYVGERTHLRHLRRLSPAQLLGVTQRAHGRTLVAAGATARARVAASATPPAAVGPVLRRLARPWGPLRRFERPGTAAPAYESLLAADGRGTDWVRPYAPPDGVHGLGDGTLSLLEELGLGHLAEAAGALGEGNVLDELTRHGAAAHVEPVLGHRPVRALVERQALETLLDALPTLGELERAQGEQSPDLHRLVELALALVPQAVSVAQLAAEWDVAVGVLARHDVDAGTPSADGRTRRVTSSRLVEELLMRIWRRLHELGADPQVDPFDDDTGSRLADLVGAIGEELDAVSGQLGTIYDDLFVDTVDLCEPERPVLVVGGLDLGSRLDPSVTIPRRLRQRVPGIERHFPGWLDNDRLDQVMAAPVFHHPMYEALHRYDPEWLLPGVGRMEPHEMVTLLETNATFVEAFMVGLNHEFARELVWREYPTDGRATSFFGFWTRDGDLTRPLHRSTSGALGDHVGPASKGNLVFLVRGELVRRYPQLLAHVVAQADGPLVTYAGQPLPLLFQLPLAPDLLLVGVDLADDDVRGADPLAPDGTLPPAPPEGSWWLTLSEHVGEPRFGLDEVSAGAAERDDLGWGDWPPTGRFLGPANAPRPSDWPGTQPVSAATLAWLLFQLPARAGFRAARLLRGIESHHG